MSVLRLQSILIFMLNRQLIIFAILAFYLLVKVLQGSRLIRVLVIELFKLIRTTYKVLYRVLSGVQVISFLTNIILQRSPYKFIGQYFFNFLFIITINLNQQGRFILLFRQQVIIRDIIGIRLNYTAPISLQCQQLIYITALRWLAHNPFRRPTLQVITLSLDILGSRKQILRYALRQEPLNSRIIKNWKGVYY